MSNLYDSKPPQPLALKGYPEKTKSYFSGKEKTLKAVLLEFIPIQNMLTCKQQQLNLESSFSTRKILQLRGKPEPMLACSGISLAAKETEAW